MSGSSSSHRVAVGYWWAVLVLSVVVSSYGNVRHAETVAPPEYLVEARWISGALPVVLLLLVEGIAIGVRAGVSGWQRIMSTLFVAALAAVVLSSSYVGLLALVRSTALFTGGVLDWGLAGVPDLLMIAATVYVMSLRDRGEKVSQPAGPWSRIGSNLVARVERASMPSTDELLPQTTVDEVPTTTDDSRSTTGDELPADVDDGATATSGDDLAATTDDRVTTTADEDVVDGDDKVAATPPTTTRHPADLARHAVVTPTTASDELAVDRVPTTDELAATTGDERVDELPVDGDDGHVDEGVDGQLDGVLTTAVVTADDDMATWRRVAADITSTAKITATADELATVLRLDAAGISKQRIADEVSRSRSTVTGWLRTAEEARSVAAVR